MPYPPPSPDDAADTKAFVIAFVMAGLAGHVNSVMLMAFGLPVSQMTGTASHLSESMALADPSVVITTLSILIGFIAGAAVSGLIIGQREFPESPRYAWALGLESLLLGLAVVCIALGHANSALVLAAIACGLQNALVASYRGLLIRTTHITGIATDLGMYIARVIRPQGWSQGNWSRENWAQENQTLENRMQKGWSWEGWLLITLIAGYIAGGFMAVLAQGELGTVNNLLLPAASAAIISGVAALYQHRR